MQDKASNTVARPALFCDSFPWGECVYNQYEGAGAGTEVGGLWAVVGARTSDGDRDLPELVKTRTIQSWILDAGF